MPDIDWQSARECVRTAQAVYESPYDFWRWSLQSGYDGAGIIPRRSTQIGIAYSPEQIIVAARGSSQWGDWGENLLALRVRWRALFPVGRIHLGFQLQARRILREFREVFGQIRQRCPNAAVFVTGHSLGGALCLPLLRALNLDGVSVEAIYTFEAPRSVDVELAAFLNGLYGDRIFRIVTVRRGVTDVVTRIPFSSFGWSHVGRPIVIRDGHPFESESEWQKARDQHPVKPLPWWRVASRLAGNFGAHQVGRLVSEIDALATSRDNIAEGRRG